jgi:hypothetical protein
MEKVTTTLAQCSYKGPDLHCFDTHEEFFHYLGRLQERSYWHFEYGGEKYKEFPSLDRNHGGNGAEFIPGDPIFEFNTATQKGNSLIGQARDAVVEVALAYGSDYILFFDDDMVFAKDTFLRLWRHQKPIIGALAFTARLPIAPVLWKFKRKWNFEKQCEDIDSQVLFDYPRDQLVQVDCIGTGVVLIEMSVFKRIKKPWFYGAVGAGEDFHFCWQAGLAGIPIFCDTAVKTSHKPNGPSVWHNEESYLQGPHSARPQ